MALTLRMLGGLTTPEIARAFLVPEATVAQRIVRAKRTLRRRAACRSRCPRGDELAPRLASVLEVVYLIFNEGYAATAGDDWMRPGAVRGRAAARAHPGRAGAARARGARAGRADGDPGLAHAAPGPARGGEPVLLLDQDRARWDRLLIGRGLAALERAEELGGARPVRRCRPRSPPATPARARRRRPTGCGSRRSTRRSRGLRRRRSSSSTARSRSGWRSARRPALELVDALADEPALRDYHLLPSVRGDLLAKLGRDAEARAELERAATLTSNARERELLLARARSIDPR